MKSSTFLCLLLSILVFENGMTQTTHPPFNYRGCYPSQQFGPSSFPQDSGPILSKSFQSQISSKQDLFKVLVLRVEFQPDNDPRTTGDGTFDLSTVTEPTIDAPPHDQTYFENQMLALSNYYENASNGKLSIESEVYGDVLVLPYTMGTYNPGTTEDLTDQGLSELFRDAILTADSVNIPFSNYDAYIVFHAGVGRDIDLGLDPTPSDIPSAFLNLTDLRIHLGGNSPSFQGISVEGGTTFIREGLILPETESQEGYSIGLLGTMTLMFGFQIGLPSLWNTQSGRSGIGGWGLMDQGSGNYQGLIPAEPCAWTKVFMGWETPIELVHGNNLEIACSQANNPNKIYRVPINDHEFYLLENRMHDPNGDGVTRGWDADGNEVTFQSNGQVSATDQFDVIVRVEEYDYGLPGSGILIWHVDENVIREKYIANQINSDPDHRGVDLEEADGAQDIGEAYGFIGGGAGSETGVLHDAWFGDNEIHMLANSSQTVEFTSHTHPSTQDNQVGETHLSFFDFSSIDTVMTFSVHHEMIQTGFPQRIGSTVTPLAITTGDIDGDEVHDLVASTREGDLFALNADGAPLIQSNATGLEISQAGDSTVFPVPFLVSTQSELDTPPIIADLNGDGAEEIITAAANGEISAFSVEGDNVQTLFSNNFSPNSITALSWIDYFIIVGNSAGEVIALDSSGDLLWLLDLAQASIIGLCQWEAQNIIATTEDGQVFGLDDEGKVEWQQSYADWTGLTSPAYAWYPSVTSPSIFTVAGTSRAMIFNTHGNEEAIFGEGILPELVSNPAIGDLDEDGQHEIAIAGNGQVFVFNINGSLMNHFPIPWQSRSVSLSSPLLGDIDGDSHMEVIVSTSSGTIEALHNDGNMVDGFPLSTGSSEAITPLLLDLDRDQDLEIAAITSKGTIFVWDLPSVYNPDAIAWGSEYHDAAHTSLTRQTLHTQNPSDVIMPTHLVYNYPNPTEGNLTTIRYRLEKACDVNIMIFDLAGEKVTEIIGPGIAFAENEVTWNLTDVSSGVYHCRVQATSDDGEKVVNFKIAVVK